MTERVSEMPDGEFSSIWNTSLSVNEAVERVRAAVGEAPRWAVLERASALRRHGVALKHHELRGRAG
jgi:hypothetical protein